MLAMPKAQLIPPDAAKNASFFSSNGGSGQQQVAAQLIPHLHELRLFAGAVQGLHGFEEELRAIGASAECITYAPWTGCHLKPTGSGKRERSPVLGGGLSSAERDKLMTQLAGRGILFGRKLGKGGGSAIGHNALIQTVVPHGTTRGRRSTLPPAPPRLLPEEKSAEDAGSILTLVEDLQTWCKWHLSSLAALPGNEQTITLAMIGVAALAGWASVWGRGIGRTAFMRLFVVYVMGHFVVFFLSVALFAEYSLLEPFRTSVDVTNKVEI